MRELIDRQEAIYAAKESWAQGRPSERWIEAIEPVDYVEIPKTGIGDLSDGYHTFNDLYYQRLVLTIALVKAYRDRAWKSWKHEDGEPCFGGGWFIVGIDTPEGSYTYHYEKKDWYAFDCQELPVSKHWDGHTDKDVTRLLSLPAPLHDGKGVVIEGTPKDINTVLQAFNPAYPWQHLENAGKECSYIIGGVSVTLNVKKEEKQ